MSCPCYRVSGNPVIHLSYCLGPIIRGNILNFEGHYGPVRNSPFKGMEGEDIFPPEVRCIICPNGNLKYLSGIRLCWCGECHLIPPNLWDSMDQGIRGSGDCIATRCNPGSRSPMPYISKYEC